MPHTTGKTARLKNLEAALELLTRAAQRVLSGHGGSAAMKRIMEAQDLISRKIHQTKGA